MFLQLDGEGERYRQLARAIERAIAEGRLSQGVRMPATRELAQALGLSRNTVVTAYETLCTQHLLLSRRGSGTYVAPSLAVPRPQAPRRSIEPPSRYAERMRELPWPVPGAARLDLAIDFQYGEPLVNLPLFTAWRRSLAWAAAHSPHGYPSAQGHPPLREQVAQYLARRRGLVCSAEDVVVCNGTQQALSLLARVLLDEGDAAAVESPGYGLTERCLLAHGAELHRVPVDEAGLEVSRLPDARLKLVAVTPAHQFPTGATMTIERRQELLREASLRGFWIMEDDYDGEFGLEGRVLPALRSLDTADRVVYVGSFSKTVFPALRLGYLVCPKALRGDIVKAKLLADHSTSGIEQAAMAHFMQSGAFERHLRKAAIELRRRRRALVAGVARHCGDAIAIRDSGAGMHCMAWLETLDADGMAALVAMARERGLGLHPLQGLQGLQGANDDRPALLLGFAGLSLAQIRLGTRLLGECLAALPR